MSQFEQTQLSGRWGTDERIFTCQFTSDDAEGPGGVLSVTEQDAASSGFTLESMLEERESNLVIEADEPGGGVAWQEGDLALARWICDDRFLKVQVADVVEGRDGAQDVASYLVSMLPWACGGEPVPEESEGA